MESKTYHRFTEEQTAILTDLIEHNSQETCNEHPALFMARNILKWSIIHSLEQHQHRIKQYQDTGRVPDEWHPKETVVVPPEQFTKESVVVSEENVIEISKAIEEMQAGVKDAFIKKINKIKASIPRPETANPIAALINFSTHQLYAEAIFQVEEIPTDTPGEPEYLFKVTMPGITSYEEGLVSTCKHRRKKLAKEQAAKRMLVKLNGDTVVYN